MKIKMLITQNGSKIPFPVFFPDATRAVLKTVDTEDIESTHTPGLLVNTYHLFLELGKDLFSKYKGVRPFMSWNGGIITDSGGFQVMSVIKRGIHKGQIIDEGVVLDVTSKKKILLTPEKSIQFQMILNPDICVCLDDCTEYKAKRADAFKAMERTLLWAERSKKEFEKLCKEHRLSKRKKPLLCAVVQGGKYIDLRKICARELVKMSFDVYGYGGMPIDENGKFEGSTVEAVAHSAPKDALLYGLGIGKPDEIVWCVRRGYDIFDCVLPTRDARHKRLYVYTSNSIKGIDVKAQNFYTYYVPDKEKYYADTRPVSTACDCLLCRRYSRGYLAHLFRRGEMTAGRLATIHNLRFYSILMEKIREKKEK